MMIQLELPWGQQAEPAAPTMTRDAAPVPNPCLNCKLRGLCDMDDCGAHLFPLDVPTTRFHDLGEYINFLKHYDWL